MGEEVRRIVGQAGDIFSQLEIAWLFVDIQIVIRLIVVNSESGSYRPKAALSGRPGDSHSRRPVVLVGARRVECDQTRQVRQRTGALIAGDDWDGDVFITHPQIDSEVVPQTEVVVEEEPMEEITGGNSTADADA